MLEWDTGQKLRLIPSWFRIRQTPDGLIVMSVNYLRQFSSHSTTAVASTSMRDIERARRAFDAKD